MPSNIPENSLVVCAGTRHLRTVDAMSAGFNLFNDTFCKNENGWREELQRDLDKHHSDRGKIPAYKRYVEASDEKKLTGGIATVPKLSGSVKGAGEEEKLAYQKAVKDALTDAQFLNKPLYIQPLGIGVYKWAPAVAASLFDEAIKEARADGYTLPITIPIYLNAAGSNDKSFEAALTKLQPDINFVYPNATPAEQPVSSAPTVTMNPESTNLKPSTGKVKKAKYDTILKNILESDEWEKEEKPEGVAEAHPESGSWTTVKKTVASDQICDVRHNEEKQEIELLPTAWTNTASVKAILDMACTIHKINKELVLFFPDGEENQRMAKDGFVTAIKELVDAGSDQNTYLSIFSEQDKPLLEEALASTTPTLGR